MIRGTGSPRPPAFTAPARGPRRGVVPGAFCRGLLLAAAAVTVNGAICSTSMGTEVAPGPVTGDDQPAQAVDAAEILSRIDAVLAGLDARIDEIRAQANEMLDHADAAADGDEQMRFEDLYGKLEAAADTLEAERGRLRSMRDELAAVGGGSRP